MPKDYCNCVLHDKLFCTNQREIFHSQPSSEEDSSQVTALREQLKTLTAALTTLNQEKSRVESQFVADNKQLRVNLSLFLSPLFLSFFLYFLSLFSLSFFLSPLSLSLSPLSISSLSLSLSLSAYLSFPLSLCLPVSVCLLLSPLPLTLPLSQLSLSFFVSVSVSLFLSFPLSFSLNIIIFFIITAVVNVVTIVLCVAYWYVPCRLAGTECKNRQLPKILILV